MTCNRPGRPEDKSPLGLHLRYAFEPGEQQGADLGNPLFDLLAAVIEGGSIRHAAQTLGCSYRYAWGSLRKWEATLGEPLIIWSQGQRARPTQFAERLLRNNEALSDAINDVLQNDGLRPGHLAHVMFIFAGNHPIAHIRDDLNAYTGRVAQTTVTVRVQAHQDFIARSYDSVVNHVP